MEYIYLSLYIYAISLIYLFYLLNGLCKRFSRIVYPFKSLFIYDYIYIYIYPSLSIYIGSYVCTSYIFIYSYTYMYIYNHVVHVIVDGYVVTNVYGS